MNVFRDKVHPMILPFYEEISLPEGKRVAVAGLVLFGVKLRRYLRQAGIRVMVFEGQDKTYQARLDEVLDMPLVGRIERDRAGNRAVVEEGLLERLVSVLRPFIFHKSGVIDEASLRRERGWLCLLAVPREVVINVCAHRDWTRFVDSGVGVYADRLEVVSPGALQNSMAIEKMKAGQRSPRNPIIVGVLRDYGYVDAWGMGIRTKVIPQMRAFNGTESGFEATEDYLKTTLWGSAVSAA